MNMLENIDYLVLALERMKQEDYTFKEGTPQFYEVMDQLELLPRWQHLMENAHPMCSVVLACAIAAERQPVICRSYFPKGLSIEAVLNFLGHQIGTSLPFEEVREIYEWTEKFLVVESSSDPLFRHLIRADERIMSYLMDEDLSDLFLLQNHVQLIESPGGSLYARQELLDPIRKALGRTDVILQLSGAEGSGRRYLLAHALAEKGQRMLMADYTRFFRQSASEMLRIGIRIAREAFFLDAGVCFIGIGEKTCPDAESIRLMSDTMLLPCRRLDRRLCLCTDPDMELSADLPDFVLNVPVTPLTRMQRIDLWSGIAGEFHMENQGDWLEAGSKFQLTPGQIRKAVHRLSILKDEGETVTSHDLSSVAAAVLPPPRQGNIRRIHVHYTLDDLKLPPAQKQKLENICAHVRYRHQVYDTWNMERKYAYGRNVSALFVGPPGTGKTMAAHVLSSMLDIPLYRVDLSQVVDKYIGETEKRLEEIFSTAENNNTILFFDEADSIFGKRSEVNDAKDKYANTEVSYILQRIEQYDGIVILATNYKKNIDEAFMRRMRYLVEFTFPSEALRREIWESCFTSEIPTDEVDFEFLARQFVLAGGSIKNIVLNAAFLAAQDGEPVGMKHILDCVRNENLKMGKTMLPQDFAEYSRLF